MASNQPDTLRHARVYQACEPCRLKKVKCNLGTVDDPHDPPCARCRRESKECHFTATRKRVVSSADPEGFVLRNKRRKVGIDPAIEPGHTVGRIANTRDVGSNGDLQGSTRDDVDLHYAGPQQGRQDGLRETLLEGAAYTEGDALDLLYRAASVSTFGDDKSPHSQADGRRPQHGLTPREGITAGEGVIQRENALKAWSDVRFVRDGLFSAEEALFYIEYFHRHLKPFTPVLSTDFNDPSTHKKLIEDNPVLAITMLMLAARYAKLPGAGSVSRGYMIHDRLWDFLQNMVMRLFWAQDPCPRSTTSSALNTGLRTLGTCEALLILTEWHPRSLHFPTGVDDISILDNAKTIRKNSFTERDPSFWMEWSWRSDRLCWSLLGTALTLAFELGLFDDCDNTTLGARETTNGYWKDSTFEHRAYRLRQYFWAYSTQMSGRLGWKYLAPHRLPERPGISPDVTTSLWIGIASLMRKGNELLFSSRQHTKEIIQNGRYIGFLYTFQPSLQDWHIEFEKADLPRRMRVILGIEYSYMRVYFYSLAAQAVIENKRTGIPPLHRSNEDFVMEVIDGATSILECVLNDLLPDGSLRCIPIRAYFRILTAALFLLKTNSLDTSPQRDVEASLSLLERVGEAFRTCSVDDAHLGARHGMLLSNLSSRQRQILRKEIRRNTAGESRDPRPDHQHGIGNAHQFAAGSVEDPPQGIHANANNEMMDAWNWFPLSLDLMDTSFVDLGFGGQMMWGGGDATNLDHSMSFLGT